MSNEKGVHGVVSEHLPDSKFRVELEGGREVLCYLSGKMKVNHVKVLLGDRVSVILDPYGGKATNRIVRRF